MRRFDVIIVGSGFGGSIMAMILRQLGRSVLMLECGKHPKFAIGESSTPLANLLLEEIARKYDLPDLATLSKWGTWQEHHPEIACGLKRGFTFYKHEFGKPLNFGDRTRQLLVAASPNERIADTHWYRPEFDAHLARSAVAMGANLIENATIQLAQENGRWRATGSSPVGPFDCEGDFVVDASGGANVVARTLGIDKGQAGFTLGYPATETLFAHFRNVSRFDLSDPGLPYPVDDAAVHHLFDGGWIWILRFNNGITSAGASVTRELANELNLREGAPAWERLLQRLPTLREQFTRATPITQFYYQPKVAFRTSVAVGRNWAALPSTVGFVDPLFSTGFVLNLLGICRLAEIFEINPKPSPDELKRYDETTFRELDQTGRLIAASFRSFSNFDEFTKVAKVYFTAAIWSETLRRLGRPAPDFLLSNDDRFSTMIPALPASYSEDIINAMDLAGLFDSSRQNWFPVLALDLFDSAEKIPASKEEITAMLMRAGFSTD